MWEDDWDWNDDLELDDMEQYEREQLRLDLKYEREDEESSKVYPDDFEI